MSGIWALLFSPKQPIIAIQLSHTSPTRKAIRGAEYTADQNDGPNVGRFTESVRVPKETPPRCHFSASAPPSNSKRFRKHDLPYRQLLVPLIPRAPRRKRSF